MSFDLENSSAASNRIKASDRARRVDMLGSVLASAAVVLLVAAIWAGSRIPPEQRAGLFQMQSALAVP